MVFRNWTWSFRQFFLAVILTAIVSHTVAIDWMTVEQLKLETMADIRDENEVITEALGEMLTGFFAVPVRELTLMANAYRLHAGDHDAFRHSVDLLGEGHSFSRVSLVDSRGFIVQTWPEDAYYIGLDLSRNGYREKLRSGESFYWSGTYSEPVTGKSNIDLLVPTSGGYFLATLDLTRLQEYIAQLHTREGALVTIVDQGGGYLAHTQPEKVRQRMKDPYVLKRQLAPSADQGVLGIETLVMEGRTYYPFSKPVAGTDWTIVAYFDRESYQEPVDRIVAGMMKMQLLGLLFALLVLYLSGRYFQTQTDLILEFTRRISDGDYGFRSPDSRFREFKELLVRFEGMAGEVGGREEEIRELNSTLEDRIQERTRQLTETNGQLEDAMADLKATQDQLLQKEKMASLVVLVTGIAHEINTPVGVCLTSSTYLTQQGERVRKRFEEGSLTKSDLMEFFGILEESGALLQKNLKTAGELISTFKQISQDQKAPVMDTVRVKLYIRALLDELSARHPEVRMEVVPDSDDPLLSCYPSDIDLMIRNLVSNGVLHGCDGRSDCRIEVLLQQGPHGCTISVADNGKGIPESDIRRIFDPFYTTKRGTGGSGLGLHIIYNIITQRYRGSVTCSSQEGYGTIIELFFPTPSEP